MRSAKVKNNKYKAIGLMSGTSMDGLDIAFCEFTQEGKKWKFDIKAAETIKYSDSLAEKLRNAPNTSAQSLWKTHVEFGKLLGTEVKRFTAKHKLKPLLISSHGHTVFHQPHNGFTCQIGDGAQIAAISGIQTVCDLRSKDVALGGQGAPLVPIGDNLLFNEYSACLNIGGIANISFRKNKQTHAFDICAANIVFNFYAEKTGKPYDKNGAMAAKGIVNEEVLARLNNLPFYKTNGHKSLGREWIEVAVLSLLENNKLGIENSLATAVEHCAFQIASVLNKQNLKDVLITGGGAYNSFLLQRIQAHTKCKLIVPDKKTVEYKEALIFAFLGLLRVLEIPNCLKSVTGAKEDTIGGAIYL
ncbi:MAG TPA: anhydro-N-acetylmuramic acid kinase [Bacteroidia bacterium]